jgi:UrcA family protein
MKTMFVRVAVGAVASGLLAGMAVAQEQNLGEVTVQGTRMVTTKVAGKTSSGIPINQVSLSYGVAIKGLDLGSPAGLMAAEKRVQEVAATACKELVRRYPNGTPSEQECVKTSTDKAMFIVNGWAALASKAPAK